MCIESYWSVAQTLAYRQELHAKVKQHWDWLLQTLFLSFLPVSLTQKTSGAPPLRLDNPFFTCPESHLMVTVGTAWPVLPIHLRVPIRDKVRIAWKTHLYISIPISLSLSLIKHYSIILHYVMQQLCTKLEKKKPRKQTDSTRNLNHSVWYYSAAQ